MMILATWTLLMGGLAVASIAVARIDDAAGAAGLLTDGFFLAGIGAVVASIVVNKVWASTGAKDDSPQEADLKNIGDNLGDILGALSALNGEAGDVPIGQVVERLDGLLANQIFDIVAARFAMIARFGYGPYGSFMSDFATGERFVSRAWSAGVDRYPGETFDYIKKAVPFFESAKKRLAEM